MPVSVDDLYFYRWQADADSRSVTVFANLRAPLPDGSTADGKLESAAVELTPEELALAQAVITRGKAAIAARLNPPAEEPPAEVDAEAPPVEPAP